ncbi:hypothetical protein [Azospirillum thermophilum]|nr:hypothetical protein [Azospirillum thermophilum]
MRSCLRCLHFLGLAAFLGSILGHVLTGALVEPGSAAFAWAQETKHATTRWLTVPGLLLTLLTGIALAVRTPQLLRSRWLRIKMGLALLVTLNATLILLPLGARLAAGTEEAEPLLTGEAVFGACNLLMIALVIVLAVARPRLAKTGGPLPSQA